MSLEKPCQDRFCSMLTLLSPRWYNSMADPHFTVDARFDFYHWSSLSPSALFTTGFDDSFISFAKLPQLDLRSRPATREMSAKPSKIGMSRISKIDSEFLRLFSTQLLSNDANECLPESPFVSGKFPLRFNSCSFLCCLHSRRNGLMICHHNNPGSERRYSRSNLSPSCLHQRRVYQWVY